MASRLVVLTVARHLELTTVQREKNAQVVRVQLPDGSILYVEADSLDESVTGGVDGEREVAGALPNLEDLIRPLKSYASQLAAASREFSADKVTMQFGCEVGIEAGGLVAIIGKAGAKSAMTVTLEWNRRPD